MEESIISKLRKIKALADKGIKGEAENAKKLLNSLLQKYNLKYEEIFNEEIKNDYEFSYSTKEEKRLFFHCIANVFGTKSEIWKECYHYKNGKMKFYLRLTSLEYALFNDFYTFHREYWKTYLEKQKELLIRAYIESQGIYDISPSEEEKDKPLPSISELKELWAIMTLSDQMRDIVPKYRKVLKENN